MIVTVVADEATVNGKSDKPGYARTRNALQPMTSHIATTVAGT